MKAAEVKGQTPKNSAKGDPTRKGTKLRNELFRLVKGDPSSEEPRLGDTLFRLVIIGAGIIFVAWIFFGEYNNGQKSNDWPSIMGIVEAGGPEAQGSMFVYSYRVDGVDYQNDSLGFFQFTDGERGKEIIETHQAGDSIEIFYNPKAPEQSCLIVGMTWLGKALPFLLAASVAYFVNLAIRVYRLAQAKAQPKS